MLPEVAELILVPFTHADVGAAPREHPSRPAHAPAARSRSGGVADRHRDMALPAARGFAGRCRLVVREVTGSVALPRVLTPPAPYDADRSRAQPPGRTTEPASSVRSHLVRSP